jgi:hypothetical protein
MPVFPLGLQLALFDSANGLVSLSYVLLFIWVSDSTFRHLPPRDIPPMVA